MSYEPGKKDLSYMDEYKQYNLLSSFMMCNEHCYNYSHGDLHPGNYSYNNKLNIYDFGYCWINKNHELKTELDYLAYNHYSTESIIMKSTYNIIKLIIDDIDLLDESELELYINDYYPDIFNKKQSPPDNQNYYENVDIIICCGMDYIKYKKGYIKMNSLQYVILYMLVYNYQKKNGAVQTTNTHRWVDTLNFCETYDIFPELKPILLNYIKTYKRDSNYLSEFKKYI